ncbi:unnamed protein product [Rotaria sordida]|uniref:Uncharacterized protein n=1 Tax=Rotaria sordida TaxID=392033 RepID=A0A815CNI1_9BILA|nr:unnamed protein product [Rotaria sordida]CAF1566310.1 unnamed protein product [Rotaria sordida]
MSSHLYILENLKHLSTINDSTYFKSPLKLDESGKLRDSTFYYRKRFNIEYCYSLIMGSNAPNGSFYVTNALDIKHETICETNYNGILLDGRLSI